MSTIDPNSTATLNKILEKIGVNSNDDTSSVEKTLPLKLGLIT